MEYFFFRFLTAMSLKGKKLQKEKRRTRELAEEKKKFYLEMAVLKLSSVLGGFAQKFALKGITKFEVEPSK